MFKIVKINDYQFARLSQRYNRCSLSNCLYAYGPYVFGFKIGKYRYYVDYKAKTLEVRL